ncbi:uncharacterized protein PAC_15667 [Phialocephala subalpina]|uniref:Uncharacterized protein n=1 Tax=Phialocephala subalpina TaxID=576137 RepID=A0A1L7XLF1_9HELO|nr:uncharacterized protein PAC_15667 [Phialocephala subalpina]
MSEPDINNTIKIHSTSAGYGLAAATLIPSGAVILKISNPLLILLEKAHLASTCSWCFIKPEQPATLKSCARCKVVGYCSTDCQTDDWLAVHSKECKVLKAMPAIPPTATRGLIQLSLRNRSGDSQELVTHGKSLSPSRLEDLSLQAVVAAKYSRRRKEWLPTGLRVLCQMETNAFRVTLPDDAPIGLCFDPIMALANHSCSPNAVVVFDGRTASFRALRELKEGEEIFISYIDPISTRDKRRQELQQRYFFECKCEKCTKDENAYETYLRAREEYSAPRRMAVLCDPLANKTTAEICLHRYAQETRIPNMLQCINDAQGYLDQHLETTNDLPPSARLDFLMNLCSGPSSGINAISPYPAVLHSLYLTFIDMESWIPALICLLSIALDSDPFTYPSPHHPVRIVRLFTLAKLITQIAGLTSNQFTLALTGLSREAAGAIEDPLCELQYFGSFQVLIGIVAEEMGQAFGEGSRFAKEVVKEFALAKNSEEMKQRKLGDAPVQLGRWMMDREDEEGRKEAEKMVRGLRRLADCVEHVVGVPL